MVAKRYGNLRHGILVGLVLWAGAFLVAPPLRAAEAPPAGAGSALNLQPGICVVLGLGEGAKAGDVVDLARSPRGAGTGRQTVFFQSPSAQDVAAVRQAAAAAKLLGKSVFVEQADCAAIPLADNLAGTILVAASALPAVSQQELMRVLHPEGRAHVGGKQIIKPFPPGQDEWTHPFHSPDNNPVSRDQQARYPYLTQFLGEPKFSPMPEVTVASAGRIFKACGNLATRANQNPALNTLYAINGFNGTILWTRPLREGFLIHRNTMIATPDVLYLGDDESCKRLDARTGKLLGQIVVPDGEADGKVWKWMAMEGGVLYALVGGPEVFATTVRSDSPSLGGWPWANWAGYAYNNPQTNTGFGRTVIAFDPATGRKLWSHREDEYLDGRGLCMAKGRIYLYSPQKFLACLEAATGKVLWKNSTPELIAALGPEGPAQLWITGFSTTSYLKCDDRYVFFAGAVRPNLVVASAADGHVVWSRQKQGNVHLMLLADALYAVGGSPGGKFEYETGKQLAAFPTRRSCTRATASVDAIFYRITEGTIRIDLETLATQHLAPMRPPCQDGVIISTGLLYWGPWMCGCPLSLYGHVCLAPAGQTPRRLGSDGPQVIVAPAVELAASTPPVQAAAGDWTCLRGDNQRTCLTRADLASPMAPKWTAASPSACEPTAPTTAGGLVFYADHGGTVRAIDAATGAPRWEAATGGAVFYPPAFWGGRLLAGSADGRLYAFDAASGRELWRCRLGPIDRRIPILGRLMSTWPLNGGVVVQDGTVYAAAGIAHYDGTFVAALDVAGGKVKWVNDTSGELSPVNRNGISLQGPLYVQGNELRFLGGTVYEIAAYDLQTGRCTVQRQDQFVSQASNAFYPYYPEYAKLATLRHELADGRALLCNPAYDRGPSTQGRQSPGLGLLAAPQAQAQPATPPARPAAGAAMRPQPQRQVLWMKHEWRFRAFAFNGQAILAAGEFAPPAPGQRAAPDPHAGAGLPAVANPDNPRFFLVALKLDTGREIWRQPLPAAPVRDGIALTADGRTIVALEDGRLMGFAK